MGITPAFAANNNKQPLPAKIFHLAGGGLVV